MKTVQLKRCHFNSNFFSDSQKVPLAIKRAKNKTTTIHSSNLKKKTKKKLLIYRQCHPCFLSQDERAMLSLKSSFPSGQLKRCLMLFSDSAEQHITSHVLEEPHMQERQRTQTADRHNAKTQRRTTTKQSKLISILKMIN